MSPALKQIAIILSATLVLLFLYTKIQDNHVHSYNSSIELLRKTKQVDTLLNQDVLKVRYNLLLHYDPLKDEAIELRGLEQQIINNKFGEEHNGNVEIRKHIDALSAMINNKLTLVESFKSRNAILKNSSRYLPGAVKNMVQALTAQKTKTALINQISDLLGNTLSYSITTDESFKSRVIEDIDTIKQNRNLYPEELRTELDHLLLHAEIITREKRPVDDLAEQITSSAIAQELDNLANIYTYYHEIKVDETRIYQTYLYVLVLAMLAYIGYIVMRLHNNATRLKRTVNDLNYQKFALDQHSIVSITDVQGKII